MEVIIAGILAIGAGIVIGLFGAGGSILLIPILTYGLHVDLKVAIAMTLAIEAVTGFLASRRHGRRGNVSVQAALPFALAGAGGAFVAGYLARYIPSTVLLVIFGAVVLGAALLLLQRALSTQPLADRVEDESDRKLGPFVASGAVVGSVTGLVGVGGGFLIVPALTIIGKVPFKRAVGTSLLVIGINSLAGLSGVLAGGTTLPIALTAVVTVLNVFGSFIGEALSRSLPARKMQLAFVGLLLILGGVTLVRGVRSVRAEQPTAAVAAHASLDAPETTAPTTSGMAPPPSGQEVDLSPDFVTSSGAAPSIDVVLAETRLRSGAPRADVVAMPPFVATFTGADRDANSVPNPR